MYQPSAPKTFPLCKNCKFFIRAEGKSEPLCGHDSAIHFDFVNGNHGRHRAQFVRQLVGKNECGAEGQFFEPTSEPVEVEAPADVVATLKAEGVVR